MTKEKIIGILSDQARIEDATADEWAVIGSTSGVIRCAYGANLLRRMIKILEDMDDD